MAKERLSKLQKWILSESYKLNILRDGSVVGCESSCYYRFGSKGDTRKRHKELAYQYFECWIYEKYYGFYYLRDKGISKTPAYNSAHVTVHRSVRNLEQKGLIEVTRYWDYRMTNWKITEKGIATLNLPSDLQIS
jgi:hypothetical protein